MRIILLNRFKNTDLGALGFRKTAFLFCDYIDKNECQFMTEIKKGSPPDKQSPASLTGSPKGGGNLLSHLVGQYHRRGRA